MPPRTEPAGRLQGLDLARFLAFVGMVVVNFKIAMGAEGTTGLLETLTVALEGRAAATFVVLAGLGLGLAALRADDRQTVAVTIKRAAFLLVIGLLNSLIFDADILHYYAFYFLFGVFFLRLTATVVIASIIAINLLFVVLIFVLDYDAGWNWADYTYADFWTPVGFVRNLAFNGWHPIVPWLSFLLFGLLLGRLALARRGVQVGLVLLGGVAMLTAEALSAVLTGWASTIDPELPFLLTTGPIPPMPLYMIAGMGAASVVIGGCLLVAGPLARAGVLQAVVPAGRQTLTLYIAHILIGMGILEAAGLLGGQSPERAVLAASVFCLAAMVYAYVWSRAFKRGPIEFLMRRLDG